MADRIEVTSFIDCTKKLEAKTKKADVVAHLEVLDHVGLLVNGSPGMAELPFI
jgi:hypothetical protein